MKGNLLNFWIKHWTSLICLGQLPKKTKNKKAAFVVVGELENVSIIVQYWPCPKNYDDKWHILK